MSERDYIGRLLQIQQIKSSEPDPISGSNIIIVADTLSYTELFTLDNDTDLTYKSWVIDYVGSTSTITLSAIGASPNANGATLTGQVLNLEPASASFGGVVTTGAQSFAGAKTFTSIITGDGGFQSAAGTIIASTYAGTAGNNLTLANGGGQLIVGMDTSTGSLTGSVYAGYINLQGSRDFYIQATGTKYLKITNTTGAVTLSSLTTGVVKSTSGVLSNGMVNLTSEVSGILPIANGGTGSSSGAILNQFAVQQTADFKISGSGYVNGNMYVGSMTNTMGTSIVTWNGNLTYATASDVKTFLNLTGTNSGDVTLNAVGSSPNANGASLSGQSLTLQPANGSNPGVLTATTQTIGGAKTFNAIMTINATNSPLIVNSTNSNPGKIALQDNGTVRGYLGATSTNASEIYDNAGNVRFTISQAGVITTQLGTGAVNATAGVLSVVSDGRVKTHLGAFKGSALNAISLLDLPEYWKYNAKSGLPKKAQQVKQFSLFADKVYEVLGEEFAPTQADGMHGLSDRALLSLAIQAIQELKKQLDTK